MKMYNDKSGDLLIRTSKYHLCYEYFTSNIEGISIKLINQTWQDSFYIDLDDFKKFISIIDFEDIINRVDTDVNSAIDRFLRLKAYI